MSVVVSVTVGRLDAERYEAITDRVMPGDQLPDGCEVHIAGPVEGGWRVITVWDSGETFTRFREDKLIPAIREVAGDEALAPEEPEVNPVHKLVTS